MTRLVLTLSALVFVVFICCGDDDDDDDDGYVQAPTFVSISPAAGSTVPGNQTFKITFDGAPKDVTVEGTPATISDKVATWTGNLSPGPVTLLISWHDGAGAEATYIITEPN